MLLSAYYGLLRAGEVASGPHSLRARDVLIGRNKKKFLFILWTSKTHGRGSKPQRIKISAQKIESVSQDEVDSDTHCPFNMLRNFSDMRPR